MMRLFECGVLMRVLLLVLCALTALTGLVRADSMIYTIAHADHFTVITMVGLAVCTVLGVIDLVVNDLMPDQYVIARALRDRHLVNMALALCLAVQMWTCIRAQLPSSIVPFYLVLVVFIPLSTFTDVRKRFNKVSQ